MQQKIRLYQIFYILWIKNYKFDTDKFKNLVKMHEFCEISGIIAKYFIKM